MKKKTNIRRLKISLVLAIILLVIFYFSLPKVLFPHDQYSTVLVDKHGDLLSASISKDEQWHFPRRSIVSPKYYEAVINFEDKRFYRHLGVDIIAFSRALVDNIRSKRIVSGGSTISMQTIRLHRRNPPRTIVEKIREMFLALRLDFAYSKEEILDLYAGHAPFGGNVIGIDAATWRYFGKSAERLSWSEAALLAVLPNSPGLIHTEKNRDKLEIKRNRLLETLRQRMIIDEESYKLAIAEEIPRRTKRIKSLAPHLLQTLRSRHGSQFFETNIDPAVQKKCLEIAQIQGRLLKENQIDNLAMLVIDIETNETIAYVGNLSGTGGNEQEYVDIIQRPRSSGSVLKPFLYAASLDEGLILERSLLPDYPIQMNGFVAENYYDQHDGLVPANKALTRSLNIPFSYLLQQYGIEKFRLLCIDLGLKTINKSAEHYGIPLILGGAEISLWDITNAYGYLGKIMNTGARSDGFYDRADIEESSILAKAKKRRHKLQAKAPIISRAAVWQTLDNIRQVTRPDEQGEWKQFSSSRTIAWKTGTSNGFKDAWAVGVNGKYAIGVWVGNADGEGRPGIVGAKAAAPIFFRILNSLEDHKWWDSPIDDLKKEAMCSISGFHAKDICPVDSQYVDLGLVGRIECQYHKEIWLDQENKFRVAAQCYPMELAIRDTIFSISEKIAYYYQQHAHYQSTPNFHPACQELELPGNLKILHPEENIKIYLPKIGHNKTTKLILRAHHGSKDAVINWHLDENYIGSTEGIHELNISISPGIHRLTIVDSRGAEDSVEFQVLE